MTETKLHRFPYEWTLADAKFAKDKGKVFSCFACGGGSTMGYKLAGFDVVGCNELDERCLNAYVANHRPRYPFLGDIRDFKLREDLPAELYQLDILDGSPPCSSFSMVGCREEAWGKKKHFREGQKEQVLDTLFFDFIDLAERLQPKVVIAENVKGLMLGNAKAYCTRIYEAFDNAGYYVNRYLLNAADMGVPQSRERVFFICIRKDLATPFLETYGLFDNVRAKLAMEFSEPRITCRMAELDLGDDISTPSMIAEYGRLKRGEETRCFQNRLVELDEVHSTLLASYRDKASPMPAWGMKWLSNQSICKIASFPQDYDFKGQKPYYLCGMSVPPVMMANVAAEVYSQWLSKL